MSLAKNIALVIISPKIGWEEINLSGFSTQKVLQGAFYPLLALLAISAFALMLFEPTEWPLTKTIMYAIIEFSSFFATYFLSSYLLGGFYPEIVKTASANTRLNNFIIYNLIYLIFLEIFNNLLGEGFPPLFFMALYTAVLTHKGTEFIGMNDKKKIPKFVAIASSMFILLPLVIKELLKIMIIK